MLRRESFQAECVRGTFQYLMFYSIGFSKGTLKGDLRHCNKILKNIYDPKNRGREHNRVRVRERYRKRDCD